MNLAGEVKPHLKDFFLYISIIVIAFFALIFLFSENYASGDNPGNVEAPAASSAAKLK